MSNLFGGLIKDPETTAQESLRSINSDMNNLVKECSCPNCGADLELTQVEPVRIVGRTSCIVGIGVDPADVDEEETFEESCKSDDEEETFEESAKPEDEEEYEEAAVAITVGDKGAQLAAQREALRNKLDQEKTENSNNLAAKKASLEQQRDILRRQAALKQQPPNPSPAYQTNNQQPVRQFANAEGADEEIEVIEE